MTAVEDAPPLGFDPFHPAFQADPYAHYRPLRESSPVYRSPSAVWVLSRHADCMEVLRDNNFGHYDDSGQHVGMNGAVGDLSFLTMDPPDHTRLRGLVSKAFTAKVVRSLRPRVQELVDELLAGLRGRTEVDLISEFAHPLPVKVISEMLGVPAADQDRFTDWSNALARGLDPEFLLTPQQLAWRNEAKAEFDDYFRGLIELRRAEPAEDLLSGLVAAEQDGVVLTEQELLDTLTLLLVAGHETTVNLIANGTLALLRNPDQFEVLRANPDRAPEAVEELLRYDPPVQLTMRVAKSEVRLGCQLIKRNDLVMALIGAANRDPEVFEDPDRLDLLRPAGRQLAFGQGIHFCLGAPLARLEGQLALAGLVRAFPEMRLLDEHPTYRENLVLRGLAALHVGLG
ncbi:cytochrome P450 [Kutzneria albida]|uniref:Cytochrome P450 n=1 Tax=Kutzneria albida DSM 43870 TaxID=1449976 RepID=W5WIQ3_9PSEU|nr:cytochrome P450 [Kutzneria albida]AHI01084.1 hypothetical protein KALB_7726 [Kutzneria albida DSM 43870]